MLHTLKISKLQRVIIALLLFVLPGRIFAQNQAEKPREKVGTWSGEARAAFGTDVRNPYETSLDVLEDEPDRTFRMMGEGGLKLWYNSPKFEFKTDASAELNRQIIDKHGESYKFLMDKGKKLEDLEEWDDFDISESEDETRNKKNVKKGKVRFDGIFKPSESDRIQLSLLGEFSNDSPSNMFASNTTTSKDTAFTYTNEMSRFVKYTINPSLEWTHKFDRPGRVLNARAKWLYANDNRYTEYEKCNVKWDEKVYEENGDVISGNVAVYRITPLYIDNKLELFAQYSDDHFADVENLKTDFSLLFKCDRDLDFFSAANMKSEQWVDSIKYRESIDYIALTAEPKAHANYKTGQFEFDLTASLPYFTDRLNSTIDFERFDPGRLDPLFNFKTYWKPAKDHRIGINALREIKRPTYEQMCWFRRPGSYSTEFQEGNADLNTTKITKAMINYMYSHGRFTYSFEAGYTYEHDRIEKTFRNEEINGTTYRIFTWKNAGYSNATNAKVTVNWAGKQLKANLMANYNYFIGVNDAGKETRNGDYQIQGDVSYTFGFGLNLQAKAKYQSKIVRSYYYSSEYVTLDTHVGQRIGKHFEVFFEGRDLLDRDMETVTFSQDFSSGREEIVKNNRLLLLLGVKYSF